MKTILAIASTLLLSTAAHADLLAVYNAQIDSSQRMNVGLYEEPATAPGCAMLTEPRVANASSTWRAVTEATTPFASGCWSREGDRIRIRMTENSDGSTIDISVRLKDFRQTWGDFNLWPTANRVTLEAAAGHELPGDVIATSSTVGGDGRPVLIQLTDAPAASCYGEDARVARVTALGDSAETQACWSQGRFEVVLWTDSSRKNEYGTVDPNFVIETTAFKTTKAFQGWHF